MEKRELWTNADERQIGGVHYNDMPIQHWHYVLANDIPYLEAQIIKYVTRWRKKNGLPDLLKAEHFLQKLIEVNTPSKLAEEPGAGYVAQDPDLARSTGPGFWATGPVNRSK